MRKISKTVSKAENIVNTLRKLLSRVKGPTIIKRKLLANVTRSIITYAIPVWGEAVSFKHYLYILNRFNRKMVICICRGYRPISGEVAGILARIEPMYIRIRDPFANCGISKDIGTKKHEVARDMGERY